MLRSDSGGADYPLAQTTYKKKEVGPHGPRNQKTKKKKKNKKTKPHPKQKTKHAPKTQTKHKKPKKPPQKHKKKKKTKPTTPQKKIARGKIWEASCTKRVVGIKRGQVAELEALRNRACPIKGERKVGIQRGNTCLDWQTGGDPTVKARRWGRRKKK